jgi:hypothetical protein
VVKVATQDTPVPLQTGLVTKVVLMEKLDFLVPRLIDLVIKDLKVALRETPDFLVPHLIDQLIRAHAKEEARDLLDQDPLFVEMPA